MEIHEHKPDRIGKSTKKDPIFCTIEGCDAIQNKDGTWDESTYEDYRQKYFDKGWKIKSCGCCCGLEWGGEYPRECRNCNGTGQYWVSPKGKHVLYPGGPFLG